MTETAAFLRDLDDAVSRGSATSRERALWHATDLLIAGRFSEDRIWAFGEIIGRLAEEIELAARVQLAKRLACVKHAPVSVINKLAFDDSIEVAGSVLRQSERLDTGALIANAKSKSQQHLLAITQRISLVEAVTDVLVVRGDQEVARSVTANQGARFSEFGFLHLIQRSENDTILADNLGARSDIPRHLFQQLIAKASIDVKEKLQRERPDMASQVQAVVTDVEGAFHAKFGPASKSYFAAKKIVQGLHQYGNLGEKQILDFASAHKLEETTVALSLLCSLSADIVERALIDNNREILLILAKNLGLSWTTTTALLFLGAPDHQILGQALDELEREFTRLNVETAKNVLKFYQSRKKDAAAHSGPRRLPQLHST